MVATRAERKQRSSSLSEDPSGEPEGLLTFEEYSKHNTVDDCWILVNNKVLLSS